MRTMSEITEVQNPLVHPPSASVERWASKMIGEIPEGFPSNSTHQLWVVLSPTSTNEALTEVRTVNRRLVNSPERSVVRIFRS